MEIKKITNFLDETLRIKEIDDYSQNGLQIENSGQVKKAGFAVDASMAAFQQAEKNNADLLIVHHGLFWDKPITITGSMYQRLKILFEANIALYAAHLPLDVHDSLGNNARIQKIMGWKVSGDFGEYKGIEIGKKVDFGSPVSIDQITREISEKFNCEPLVWNFGKEKVKNAGYVSGGAVGLLQQAIDEEAWSLYQKDPSLAREYLTDYSVNNALEALNFWKELAAFLIARYSFGTFDAPYIAPEWWKESVKKFQKDTNK